LTVSPRGALPDTFTVSIGGYEDTFVNPGGSSDTNYGCSRSEKGREIIY
jgi:hypothetical protein